MTVPLDALLAAKQRLLAAEDHLFAFIVAHGGIRQPRMRELIRSQFSAAEAVALEAEFARWQGRQVQA